MGIAWNLQIAFGSMVIFTILILPIHEHGMCFHLFVTSMISFSSVLQLFLRSFTSLFRYILSYYFFKTAVVKGVQFLISFSAWSLLVCSRASDLCTLILYAETLLNSFISSSSFLEESLGSSRYVVISSAHSDSFISSLPVWMPFIYFPCLIDLARTFSVLLNKSGESQWPSLCCSPAESECFQLFLIQYYVGCGFVCQFC